MAKQASECEEYHKRHIEEQRKCIFEREMAFLNKKHDLIRGMRCRTATIEMFVGQNDSYEKQQKPGIWDSRKCPS